MTTKRRNTIEPPGAFAPDADTTSGTGTDDTLTGQFGLTGNYQSGLRSPDAIDRPGNVLSITTSANVQALPPEQMAQLQAQLLRAGLLPSTYKPTGTLDEDTRKALTELKAQSQASGMSDLDTLRTSIEQRALAASGAYGADLASGGQAADNSPAVSVNKTVTEPLLTDPMTARGFIRDAMQSRLGRAPTADEYHQFRNLLSNTEGGQDVTTTRSVTKPGKTDNDSSTTTRVTRSDDTTDPTPATLADEMTRKGALGREANTVQAADFMRVIQQRVGL